MSLQERTAVELRHIRSRAKRHAAWEAIDHASGGLYTEYLRQIAARCPTLTPMELRVSALVRALHPTWMIAEKLCLSEKTVENHRTSIHHKLGISGKSLKGYLIRF